MDSAIRLSHRALPAAAPPPHRFSSGPATPSASRVHLSLSHGSLSLSNSSKNHRITRPFHINSMLDRFSSQGSQQNHENEESDGIKIKIVRGMRGVCLVLACVVGGLSLSSNKMNPKSHLAYACWPWSASDHAHHTQSECPNADVVINSFLQMIQKGVPSVPTTHSRFQEAPSRHEIEALKLYAMSVSNYGDASGAVRILESEYEWWKKKEKAEAEHFLEMALIQLLFIQRKFQEASIRLDNRIHHLTESIAEPESHPSRLSIHEIYFYKAIAETLLDNKDKAKFWLDAFKAESSQTSPQPPPHNNHN